MKRRAARSESIFGPRGGGKVLIYDGKGQSVVVEKDEVAHRIRSSKSTSPAFRKRVMRIFKTRLQTLEYDHRGNKSLLLIREIEPSDPNHFEYTLIQIWEHDLYYKILKGP